MHCPTCASPLPVGAMFCGECGRAVTSADVAAAEREAVEAARAAADRPTPSLAAPPAPAPVPSSVEPGAAEPRSAAPEPDPDRGPVPAAASEAPAATPVPSPSPASAPAALSTSEGSVVADDPGEVPRTTGPDAPASSVDPDAGEPPARRPWWFRAAAGRQRPDDDGPPPWGDEAEPPRPIAPLRVPATTGDAAPRPTSAPLWTASLTPAPADASGPDDSSDASGQPEGQGVLDAPTPPPGRPAGMPDDPAVPRSSGIPALREPAPEHAPTAGDTAPVTPIRRGVVESLAVAHGDAKPAHGDAKPADGDRGPDQRSSSTDRGVGDRDVSASSTTAAPVPLVEPGPPTEPGAHEGERCTHCGAPLHEDDIFCGECGAVIASVALSFTGPITPLSPGWRAADVVSRGGSPVVPPEPVAGADRPATADSRADADSHADAESQADARGPVPSDGLGQQPEVLPPASLRPAPLPAPAPPSPRPGRHRDVAPDEQAGGHLPEPIRSFTPPGSAPLSPVTTSRPPVAPLAPTGAARPPVTVAAVPPLPPVPSSSGTPWRPARPVTGPPTDDDDVDETRLVRRAPLAASFLLQFSTGESTTVDGSGLLGRAPTPQPGERFDQLVRIVDPGKSVSKTHLEFGQDAGALWISDRWSGNGTVVRPPEQPARRAEPGTRVRVARGTRVEIGEQFFVVI